MKSFSIFLIFSFVFLHNSNAQQTYTWNEYGIGFTLADDFVEEANSIDEFSATGDGMSMSIIPFKDSSVSDNDITAYTIEIAQSLNLQEIDDVNVLEMNDFIGGYVEGYKDGVKIFLMGLIDPDTDTNFFVIITFVDQDVNATEEAINIVTSIHKL